MFRAAAEAACDTLYVVGGLYGNAQALARVLELFGAEPARHKRLVFNGDFHWFDVDPAVFAQIAAGVAGHTATRGNVETELTAHVVDGEDSEDAGCGCAYPDWVGAEVVDFSNRIIRRLRHTALQHALHHSLPHSLPHAQHPAALSALPMWRRFDVAGRRVAVVHGDAESLAGWGFAQEALHDDDASAQRLAAWFEAAQVDIFASSHTCLPIFHTLQGTRAAFDPVVLNNGAAGMPNFKGSTQGLLTRIASTPFAGPQRLFGIERGGLFMDGIGIDFDAAAFQAAFSAQWPTGSDAERSYGQRIAAGPAYGVDQAVRYGRLRAGP